MLEKIMKKNALKNAKSIFESDGILGKQLFQSEIVEIVHLQIQEKRRIEKHTLPISIIFYIIQGKGILETDSKSIEMKTGDLIKCPPDIQRSWINREPEVLEILGIKYRSSL